MGNNLKARRKLIGLSQQQVADLFKSEYHKSTVRQQNISEWEKGMVLPTVENALILAKIYNCKVEDLFTLD